MIEVKNKKVYNCSVHDYLTASLDKNYPEYIISHEDQVIDFIIKKNNTKGDITYQMSEGYAKVYLPNFIEKIVGNKSFHFQEITYTNFKLKTKQTIIKSSILSLLNSNMETSYKFTDIGTNKCEKETITKFKSNIPIIGSKVEEYSIDRIKIQNNDNDNRADKWIQYWLKNYKSLSTGET